MSAPKDPPVKIGSCLVIISFRSFLPKSRRGHKGHLNNEMLTGCTGVFILSVEVRSQASGLACNVYSLVYVHCGWWSSSFGGAEMSLHVAQWLLNLMLLRPMQCSIPESFRPDLMGFMEIEYGYEQES